MRENPIWKAVTWVGVLLVGFWILSSIFVSVNGQNSIKLSYGQFLDQVERGNIVSIDINSQGHAKGEFVTPVENRMIFYIHIPFDSIGAVAEKIKEKNKHTTIKVTTPSPYVGFIWSLASLFIFFLFLTWFTKKRGLNRFGGGLLGGFTKSRARLTLQDNGDKKTFQDVAGADEAKEELQEIIEFLKEPSRFTKLGGRIPKGVLLVGPPGTGKTLLASAVAGEAGVPFFSISGSEFVELYVGVGASRVRSLFEEGKQKAPCIIFIDEIDAVGRSRSHGSIQFSHEEREQTLNQLLAEMDGFDTNKGVIVIAASNRSDVLDPALLRPGRFDRRVVVDKPDVKGRLGILKIHTRKITLEASVDLSLIARGTVGFTGADLANLANEAALLAGRENADQVSLRHFELAKDKILMGAERKSMFISPEEKRVIAYHEAGHAVVAMFIPASDPIHKITIIPRGLSLGSTHQLPTDDKHNLSKTYLESRLAVLMAGRIAEEMFVGQSTTGAGNDIELATELARRMVCEWGMSRLGPIKFSNQVGYAFFGRQSTEGIGCSDDTARKVDTVIAEMINQGMRTAKITLEENRRLVEQIVSGLMEKETLDAEDIRKLQEPL